MDERSAAKERESNAQAASITLCAQQQLRRRQ